MATYAFSDLHGRKDLWLKANKEVFGPNDTIYFLGDAPDRGPDGWEMFKSLLDDERVIYLMGNHEDMLYNAVKKGKTTTLYWNGGKSTFEAFKLDTEENQRKYINKLKNLPLYVHWYKDNKNVILSHAGMTPDRPVFNREDWFWDREHLHDEWFGASEDVYIIHGHTPVQNLVEYEGIVKPIRYCHGHKIDIDLGAFVSNKIGILNLDTFEEIIISLDE